MVLGGYFGVARLVFHVTDEMAVEKLRVDSMSFRIASSKQNIKQK